MDNHDASTFARALFDGAPDDLWVLAWTSHDKRSHWFPVGAWQMLDDFADSCNADSGPINVYIGAGLLPGDLGPKSRGAAEQRAGIPGLWADIDYGSDGHQKTSLPPDAGGAWQIINELSLTPTLVVHSGHGLQAWWLFHEFWAFAGDDERERAAALVRGWQATIRSAAGRHGWTIDSTWDLARVMRLPGTFNVKRLPAVPVTIARFDAEARYSPEEIEPYCRQAVAAGETASGVSESPSLTLGKLPGDPPFDKFQNLFANDEEFRKVYDHKRKLEDDSLSGYDLALANIAVKAGWSDDEIVGLLVAHRRRFGGGGPKHAGYYEATISKARTGMERVQAASKLEEMLSNGAPPSRDDVLTTVSAQLGVTVTGLIEYTGDQPTYRLETAEKSILLGSALTLTQQTRFRTKMIEVAGFLPEPVKEKDWVKVVNALLSIRDQQTTGDENSENGVVRDWLSSYLYHSREPVLWDQIERAVRERVPFRARDGELCIYSTALRSFVTDRAGDRVTRNELAAMLRGVGCEPKTLGYYRADGTWTTTSAWIIPGDALYALGGDNRN